MHARTQAHTFTNASLNPKPAAPVTAPPTQVMSPFTPFLTEVMYQNLRRCLPEGAPESVHFCDIPEAREVC